MILTKEYKMLLCAFWRYVALFWLDKTAKIGLFNKFCMPKLGLFLAFKKIKYMPEILIFGNEKVIILKYFVLSLQKSYSTNYKRDNFLFLMIKMADFFVLMTHFVLARTLYAFSFFFSYMFLFSSLKSVYGPWWHNVSLISAIS